MRLPRSVLDVVRGASGVAVALAIGCSSQSATITREPAARLIPSPGAVTHVASVATPPTAPTAVLVPSPPSPPVVATVDPPHAVPQRHRPHRNRLGSGNPMNDPNAVVGVPNWNIAAPACGRG